MLDFKSVSLRRGTRLLLENARFTIHKGQKVGVTGANGIGKSSLFALIRRQLSVDSGEFSLPPNLVLAHVAQETPATEQAAIDYIMDGDHELRLLQKQLAEAEQQNDGIHQADLHAKLEHIGGYSAQARAAQLMSGLGFSNAQLRAPASQFSGGWRMRLNLAQALMCRSDILLLDEPSNHLDLDAVIWLQDWLSRYPGTLLLISHDREFLDRITDHILHIEQQTAELFKGNYSAFELRRAEKLSQQQAAYEKQKREMAHVRQFVDRFRAQATKARQVQSRIKALEKIEVICQAYVDSPFNFSFREPDKLPMPLLALDQVRAGYDDQVILDQIKLSLMPGDRVGLLGPNGAGKSTLMKVLAGELNLQAGERQPAQELRIAYFAQHQLEQLEPLESPLWHLQQLDKNATEKELRNYLGGFGFIADQALDIVAPLSGGEKSRLVLAILVYQKPNLLLLDEPTNHLDLQMRYALGMALQSFPGAIVAVSHDRHFLRTVTDQLMLVADQALRPYSGDLDDYRLWLIEQRKASQSDHNEVDDDQSSPAPLSRKEQRRLEADKRQTLRPLQTVLKQVEGNLDKLNQEKKYLESELANPKLYDGTEKALLNQLLKDKGRVDCRVQEAEEAWIEASEALENLLRE